MGTDLDDPVVLPRRLDHGPPLRDRHRQGLLDVHVLAGPARLDHLDRMPVVRRGDHHRVDVLPFEDGAEVLHARDVVRDVGHPGNAPFQVGEPRIDPGVVGIQVGSINIAERDDPRVGVGEEPLEELAAPVAHADEAQADLIVGPEHVRRCQCERGAGGGGGLREIAAVQTRGHRSRLSCSGPEAAPGEGNRRCLAGRPVQALRPHQIAVRGRCQGSRACRRPRFVRYNDTQRSAKGGRS